VTVLVEGFEPDQIGLARDLARRRTRSPAARTESVRLAGPGPAPPEALALATTHGVTVEPHTDLDSDPGPADVAYLDVWTPDVAPRVEKLRERGARVTSLGDLLLERARGLTIGITGTAGKTTAATITRQLLLAAGVDVDASTTGRLGNLWPTAELLDCREHDPARPLLLELTSSHLAFMRESPRIAAVTCFWPDHLELHGSLDAYRAAKETIVRGQRPGDTLVVNADDPAARAFADITPAALVEVSLERPVERGVFVREGTVVVRWDGAETDMWRLACLPYAGARRGVVLLAIATTVAAGAPPAALRDGLGRLDLPAYRGSHVATIGRTAVAVVDDGMAATPSKTAASLAAHPDGSVVLIAGGIDDLGAGPVHAAPEEQELLERACNEIARSARLVVLFGPAADRLQPALAVRGVATLRAEDLEEAVDTACSRLEQACLAGAATLVFSPMFPVGVADRERFSTLICGRQAGAGR
jgi:UDP-N-acetylmuramoylalanine--D-glutamate ligase